MEEILGAHFINDDDFWGNNPTDVSIDTIHSGEMMTGRHITELHTHKHKELFPPELLSKYQKLVPPELLRKVPDVSQICDSTQKCQLEGSNKSKDSNMLSKTNNVTHTYIRY